MTHRAERPQPEPAPASAPKALFDRKNLSLRLGSASAFAIAFLTLLYFGEHPVSKLLWLGTLAAAIIFGCLEFRRMAAKQGLKSSAFSASLLGLGLLLHFYLSGGDQLRAEDPLPLWLVLFGGAIVIHIGGLLFRKDRLENALANQALSWMSGLYLGLGCGFMMKLFMYNETTLNNTGARFILALFLIIWLGDTFAYFVGSAFGKHKMAPSVSPKKSWEGLFGNYLGNFVGALIIRQWVCTQWSFIDALSIALLLGTVGFLGDLVESAWKRSAGVKDSNVDGPGIPGHGGVLDRLDSLMLAAPALFAYIHYVHGLH